MSLDLPDRRRFMVTGAKMEVCGHKGLWEGKCCGIWFNHE